MQPLNPARFQNAAFITPTRILVATDLIDSDILVPHAVAQAKASAAGITLVHAIVPANPVPAESGYAPYADEVMMDREVRTKLERIAREVEAAGISCDISFKHSFAAAMINEAVKSTGATRLIMASHGRGKLRQMMLGSIANELLGHVEIPIFVVGPHSASAKDHEPPRKILHPVSLSGDYRKSAELAYEIARFYRAELTLLHALDDGSVNPERSVTWANNALAEIFPHSEDSFPIIRTIAAIGEPVEETLNAANQTGADWIVLGVNAGLSHSPFQNSKAYKVLAAANCSVLTVRHDPLKA